MAFCTQCGIIMHEDDRDSHVCTAADKPKKGKPQKMSRTLKVRQ